MKPLSIGNVGSAGLKIYRDHFKDYYYIAFIGALWSIIPIYGWAKFMANMGLISRLAFGEVANKPETIQAARRHTQPKLWKFLGAGIAVFLRFIGFYLLWLVALFVIIVVAGLISGFLPNVVSVILSLIIGVIVFLSFFGLLIWLTSRYLIVDVTIAVEADHNADSAIKRTVDLSTRNIRHIFGIVLVAILISIPLWAVALTLQLIPSVISTLEIGALAPLATILSLVVSYATNALIAPVWQSIKAVIYYNLLVRREGYGLELDV